MKTKKNHPGGRALLLFLTLLLLSAGFLNAEALVSPEWGYALDLPEAYVLAERNGTSRYHFSHNMYPVELQIALYPRTQFTKAVDALTFVTAQLESKSGTAVFEWRTREASLCMLKFATNAGWALSLELAGEKGWLVMACFTSAARATELEPLMISTLDSVFTDDGSYFETGPMSAFAWPKEKNIEAFYTGTGKKISVPFNSIDAEANQFIVDREFKLLTAYLDSPLVYDAWKRYYRMIYRDAWARLVQPAFIVQNTLPADSAAIAAKLLAWTQTFTYERNFEGSDFHNIPDAFMTQKADCDSRALLLVLLLNQMGIDAVLLVSPEYSHSVAAVDCEGPGARFTVGNKKYLIADTTAKVGIGLIDSEMADPAKWFAVTFAAFPKN